MKAMELEIKNLDWNRLWKAAKDRASFQWDKRAFWNKRAPEFAVHAAQGEYAARFLELFHPNPAWSILDVGCGAGTLALPLSSRVKSVTALDISDRMLEILNQRCQERGIRNIRTVRTAWDDDWAAAGVDAHDVIIASRSFYSDDLASAVDKLDRLANKAVVLVSSVGDGPYDRRQYEAIGRRLDRGPDFIFVLNYLLQTGRCPELRFIAESEDKIYPDLTAAMEGQRWMFQAMTPEEERSLLKHLADRMVTRSGGMGFPEPKITRWAYIRWDPKERR